MLRLVISVGLFASVVFCATTPLPVPSTTHKPHTHRPHATHQPSEHSAFRFIYEPVSHKFVISTGGICYIFPLTVDERIAVHSDAGIKALELKLASAIDTATRTQVQRPTLSHNLQNACPKHATAFYRMVL